MTRAHARRHDQNVVARADASIASPGAPEGTALAFGDVFRRRRVQTLGQISYDGHVVRHVRVRDLLATAYAQRGSDGLAKLAHKFAHGNVARRKTMAWRHRAEKFHGWTMRQDDFEIRERRLFNYRNVVVVIDDDGVFT